MKSTGFSRGDFLYSNSFYGLLGTIFLNSSFTDEFYSPKIVEDILLGHKDKAEFIDMSALIELRSKYHSELFDKFLPNMDKLIIDHDIGGFMCDIDNKKGKLLSTKKRAWFEGRGIWLYSFLYNHFGNNPTYLEVATKSKNFILKHIPSDGSFWNSSFTKEGSPLPGKGDIFSNLYIAEGLAEYSKASGEIEYFNLAKKLLLQCVKEYDKEDYEYASEKSIKGPRVLNHWMIMLCNSTQMLNYKEDSEIESLAKRCVDAILNNHFNPDWQLLDVVLAHDLNRLSDREAAQKISFGLGIQALWMVLSEAVRRKDLTLFDKAKKLFKRHIEVAKDNVYGGYYWSIENISSNTYKLGKVLSLHDEVLIGSLLLVEHQADQWALDCFYETYSYINNNFIKEGYVFPVENGDRKIIDFSDKGMGIYHHPRQLVLNLQAIDRIINRKGEISHVFVRG
ncbi:MAG: AGE family epimerase/isomerase [Pedobacter sp.]|jgi:mannose/cellobiose epimerase-like protein (N-acyl-D-glucosamine 2-epimerase family)